MASPLQLTYSYIWQVIRQKNVKLYGRVEEFVTMVTQTVPELMSFKQTAQLLLGLRARVRRSQTVQSADIGTTNSTPTLCTLLWLFFWRIFGFWLLIILLRMHGYLFSDTRQIWQIRSKHLDFVVVFSFLLSFSFPADHLGFASQRGAARFQSHSNPHKQTESLCNRTGKSGKRLKTEPFC